MLTGKWECCYIFLVFRMGVDRPSMNPLNPMIGITPILLVNKPDPWHLGQFDVLPSALPKISLTFFRNVKDVSSALIIVVRRQGYNYIP
jgi:hypothetical protein